MAFGGLGLAIVLGAQSVTTAGATPPAAGRQSVVVDVQRGDVHSVQGWKTGGAWTLRVRDPSGGEAASVRWREPPVVTLTWTALQSGQYIVTCEPTTALRAACEIETTGEAAVGDSSRRARVEAALWRGYEFLELWSREASERAQREFGESLDLSRSLGLADLEVDSLLGLAAARQLAGDVEESVRFLDKAATRADQTGDRKRFVLASAKLSSSLATLGQADRAQPHADAAIRLAAAAGFPLGAAEAHLGLADVHYYRSELGEARREYEAAFETFERLGNDEGLIEAELGLGYVSTDLSQDAPAVGHFERALDMARSLGDKRLEATALRLLGNVHSKMLKEYEAIGYFQAAQTLLERADDQVALVRLYNGLGEVHGRLNDLPAAIQYHRKAEALARSTGLRVAGGAALLEIAAYQKRLGQLQDAASSFEKARALFESIGDAAMVAAAVEGLGNVAAAEGRFEVAIRHLQTALAMIRSVGESRFSSGILNDLAETYLSMGQAGPSGEAAREALRLAREATDPVREARALFLLARVARERRALDEAKELAEQSLDAGESIRARVPGHELRALFFEDLESRYRFYVDLLMEMEDSKPEAPFERLAFAASERGRARVLLDRLDRGVETPTRAGDEGAERESALREEIRTRALQKDLGAQKGGDEGEAQLSEKLAELRRVEGLGRGGAPGPEKSVRFETAGIDEIQSRLAEEGTLLVEYCLGAERSYLWTIRRDRVTVHLLPARDTLEREAKELYTLLTARQREIEGSARERRARAEAQDARLYEAGRVLSRALLGPIDDLDAYQRLVIVSDGLLNYIPFSALPHPRAGAEGYVPLVLSHEVVRVPSLAAMVALGRRSAEQAGGGHPGDPGQKARVAVLADPVFTADDPRVQGRVPGGRGQMGANLLALNSSLRGAGPSLATLPRLLASREEASSIARAAVGADVRITTDFAVDRAKVEEALGSYRVVHVATHGILNDEHPALSGIIASLVDEEGRAKDGFLRAQDVYGMRVGAELVVLSACDTALGQMLKGEGITGLVHAFLNAGAHTVVASKWRVDDVATQELMTEFYRQMFVDHQDPAAALRGAQITLLRRRGTQAPFFWAAFEVHGISSRLAIERAGPETPPE